MRGGVPSYLLHPHARLRSKEKKAVHQIPFFHLMIKCLTLIIFKIFNVVRISIIVQWDIKFFIVATFINVTTTKLWHFYQKFFYILNFPPTRQNYSFIWPVIIYTQIKLFIPLVIAFRYMIEWWISTRSIFLARYYRPCIYLVLLPTLNNDPRTHSFSPSAATLRPQNKGRHLQM